MNADANKETHELRIPRATYGCCKWAWDKLGINQEQFIREALRAKVSEVAKQRGGRVPPFIVEFLNNQG